VGEENSADLQSSPETLVQVTHFVAHLIPAATPETVCAWIDRGDRSPSERYWTLDPVDGTKGFLRGGQYAIALALISNGQPEIGILGCPNLNPDGSQTMEGSGALFVAQRGAGSYAVSMALENPINSDLRRSQAAMEDDPRRARLLRSFEAGHTNVDLLDQLVARLNVQAEAVRMDSQAKYAVLAAGKGEVIVRLLAPDKLDYKEKIWDHAAGGLVVEEAGGRLSDLDGKPLDFTAGRSLARNRGLLATNRSLHSIFLETLQALGA
jgi:3'(2'), 5'-bisphosphate nucleotidase